MKEIQLEEMWGKINKALTSENKTFLESKTAKILPNNPTSQGFSADQIRKSLYEGILVLFEWLKTTNNSNVDFNNKVMETLTAITENNEEDKQDLANLKQALIDGTFNVKYLTWAIMATNDENGNRIIDTYATIERLTQVLEALTQEISDRKAADDLEKKERKEETSAIINSVNQEISDRTNAVSVLNNLITAETENRASEDEKVLQYAQSVNEALGNAKTDLQGKIDSEAQTRLTNDNEIKASITSKEDSLKALINSVKTELNGYITTLNNRVNNLPTNYVFDTYESMKNDLLNASNTKYKVGDTLFIKEVNKPDYWVSAILSTKGTYGYYELSEQESKVDLSSYVKISELSREAIEEKFLETVENGTKSFAARSFTATDRNSGIDVNNYTQYVYDGVFFHKNGVQYPIAFPEKDGVFALLSDIPQTLKNPFALTINGKVYDGSSAVSITTETITEHDFVRFWHAGIEIQNDGSEHVLRFSDFDTELEEFSPHISCQYDGPQYYWVWKFPQISGTFAMESQIPTKLSQLTNDGNYQTNTSDLKDNTTTFTTASSRSNVASGEKLSVSFGKIAKYFTDLKAIAFSGDRADIGLGNVDNTSDADKPVSNATQQALNLKANASDVYTKTETDGLLNDKANANDVYSKTKTDELLNDKANKSDVYTKSETDNKTNKSLYNLGAYDTISGNVITRQTGYVDLGTLDWALDGNNRFFNRCGLDFEMPSTSDTKPNVISAKYSAITEYEYVERSKIGISIAYSSSIKTILIYDTNYNDVNTFKSAMQGVILQYKLATSYTEEIIEGQPLITLDQQGSQWLRDEWEKGLNVFDIDTVTIGNGYDYTATASDWVKAIDIPVEPNTTYTASSIISRYAFNHGDIVADYNKNTITTGSDTKTLSIFIYVGSYSGTARAWFSNYMLNKGSIAYPYQPYNGEIVHDKDIADLYKQEYNLGYYDTIVENSDGTYTITRQTGYIVLDGSEDGWGIYLQGLWAYIKVYNIIPVTSQSLIGQFITNRGPAVSIITMTNTSSGVQIAQDGESINIRPNVSSINSLETFKQWLSQNNIAIQYKLKNITTEKVEKNHYARYNQTFILDHNKSEAERSANLFNNTNNYSGTNNGVSINVVGNECVLNGTSTAGFFNFLGRTTLKAGTYSFSQVVLSGSINGDINSVKFGLYENGGSLFPLPGYKGTYTLTQDTTLDIVVWFGQAGITFNNCKLAYMLNEGSVALPYQPYEGKVVHEKELESITPGIFSLVGNNVDTLTISKNETYFITSVAVNPIYVEGNTGISFIGSSLVTTVGMLSGEPKICLNGSAYTLDNNSVTLKTSGLMKAYKVNY